MINHPFFNNTKYTLKDFKINEYAKDALIFSEGDICSKIGLIMAGSMKISTINYDSEYVINIVNEKEIFGDALIFNDENRYLGDGIALSPLKILYLNQRELLALLKEPEILTNYLKILSKKNLNIKKQLKLANQKTIKAKILFYLTAKAKESNSFEIPIISKEHLAQILNIPRPSLSRELLKMQKEKIIELKKKKIIIMEHSL